MLGIYRYGCSAKPWAWSLVQIKRLLLPQSGNWHSPISSPNSIQQLHRLEPSFLSGWGYRGQIPASPQQHPELGLVLGCSTNAFVCKFTCHGVMQQDALTGSRYKIICPHVPMVVLGNSQEIRIMKKYFSHQELFLSAFFRVTVSGVGRDMEGPSSTALYLLHFH